jgi:hypothetical protein
VAKVFKARNDYKNLTTLVEQFKASFDPVAASLLNPNPNVISLLQSHADEVGFKEIPSAGNDTRNIKGYVSKQYSVTFLEKDPDLLLKYLSSVISDPKLAGLDIWRLKLTPSPVKLINGNVGWNLEVGFKRWQRD